MPSRAETWNSYYYGAGSVRSYSGVTYRDVEGADDQYQLPDEYRGYDVTDPRIPDTNKLSANPF